jgi:DNA/RNA-binding domain of Phe-tRNA-synthetase-like protein
MREKFPGLRIGILLAHGIDNLGTSPALDEEKAQAAATLAATWSLDQLMERPEIQAWQDAYRAFGVKPRSSRPTAEAFLRRLIGGNPFPTISKAVDAYLLVETRHFLPIGGYDLDFVQGDITLRISSGDESFTPIGAKETEQTAPGEVVYGDEKRVLTRKWNFRDADECKITPESRRIALFTEAPFASVPSQAVHDTVDAMAAAIGTHCGGTVTTRYLDASEGLEISLD